MKQSDQENHINNEVTSHDENKPHSEKELTVATTRDAATTPNNSIIDVFEFEPVGFMSKGRW